LVYWYTKIVSTAIAIMGLTCTMLSQEAATLDGGDGLLPGAVGAVVLYDARIFTADRNDAESFRLEEVPRDIENP
jgi:hypothetical protein